MQVGAFSDAGHYSYRTVGVIPGFCRDTLDATRFDSTTIMYKNL